LVRELIRALNGDDLHYVIQICRLRADCRQQYPAKKRDEDCALGGRGMRFDSAALRVGEEA